LGRHGKPSRIRVPHGAPTAAAGVAAAFCLSPGIAAAPAAQAATVAPAGHQAAPQLLSAARQDKPDSGLPASYAVRPGDSLSVIAGRLYRNPAAWPVLYWGNRSKIRWADDITAGQVLRVPAEPARIPGPPAQLGPPQVRTVADYVPRHAAPVAAPAQAVPAQAAPAQADSAYSGDTPRGAFGQCVVARESGGNAQVMNSTGHYGLYQFSAATWAAYGGDPAEFGDATVTEQNQVFASALAAGGESNWAPYDGC
jgi:hypothetical protein